MKDINEIILIIEDDEGLSELLRDKILNSGFETICVFSAKSAIEWLKEHTPLLMLLDYSLPDMTGKELIAELKTTLDSIPPFIIATGQGDERIAVDMMKLGARDYVVKDVNFMDMISLVVSRTCTEIINENKLIISEQALNESNQFNKQVIASAQEGIIVYDCDLKYQIWNPFMEDITGVKSEAVIGKKTIDVFPFLKDKGVVEQVANALQGAYYDDVEFYFEFPASAKSAWVTSTIAPFKNSDNEIIGVITTVRDITERKLVQQEVEKSRIEFKDLFDNAPIGYHEIDLDGRIVRMNVTELTMLGYSFEELRGKYIWDLVVDRKNSIQITTEKLRSRQLSSVPYEREFIRKDGMTLSVLVMDKLILSSNGEISGIRSSVQDITERKRVEEALKTRESYLTAIIENLPGIIWLKDEEGRFLTTNRHFAHTFGFDKPQDLVGKTDLDIAPLEYAEKYMSDDKKVVNTKMPLFTEEIIVESGIHKYFETFKMPAFDENKQVIGTTGYAQDISERKNTETALLEKELQYRTLANNGIALIWTAGIDKRCNYFNDPWLKFTGRSLEQELGDGWFEGIHPDDFDRCTQIYAAAFDKQEAFNIEFRLKHSSGEYRWVTDMGTPNYNSSGNFIGYIGQCYDINDKKAAHDEIVRISTHYQALIEKSPAGFVLIDEAGQFKYFSPSVFRMFGYSVDEVFDLQPVDMTHPDDLAMVLENLGQLLQDPSFIPVIEYRFKHKNGDWKWIESTISNLLGDAAVGSIVINFRDIHERKIAEEKIKNNEILLNKLLVLTTEFIDSHSEKVDFKKVSDSILDISGAKYASFNLFEADGLDFTTVAISGIDGLQEKVKKIFGYELLNKKWKHDPARTDKLKNKIMTKFDSFFELSGFVISKRVSTVIEDMFNLGEVWVIKITKSDITLGDYTLLFTKGNTLQNREIIELYCNQLALFLTRIQIEKNLKISEEKFRSIADQTPDLITITDNNGVITYASPASRKLFYAEPDEMCGKKFIDFLDESSVSKALGIFNHNLITGDRPVNLELLMKRKDGSLFVGELNGTNYGGGKRLEGTQMVIRDITERKMAEEALISTNSLLNATLESTADGILVVSVDGKVTAYNQKFVDMFSIPSALLVDRIDKKILDYTANQMLDQQEFYKTVINLYDNPFMSGIDEIELADGRIFERYSIPQKLKDTVVGRVWSFRDITDRIVADEALRASEDKYRTMIEFSNDLIWTLDSEGKFMFINQVASETTGLEIEEWKGKSFIPLVFGADVPMLLGVFEQVMGGENVTYELRLKKSDDSELTILVNASPIYVSGEIVGVVSFGRDITDKKQAEKALADKMNELVRFHNLTVDRELSMIELKKEVNNLLRKTGSVEKYKIVE